MFETAGMFLATYLDIYTYVIHTSHCPPHHAIYMYMISTYFEW